ncbi:MAG TPA: general secretion pathway protein GspB [Tepidisphaeraceae bacterium]|nr:general secretion pathway protein GspB [Tepidisphaeraceae bacterium]
MTQQDDNFDTDDADRDTDNLASALNATPEAEFVYEEPQTPKRNGLIVAVGVLAICGGGLFLMHKRTGPAAASANPEVVSAQKTINTFLSGGGKNREAMETMLRDTEKVVQMFLVYPSVNQVPLDELKTNPFRHESNDVRKPDGTTDQGEEQSRKQREQQRAKVLAAVQTLQLGSIMHSDTRRACMINNTLYLEGQTVEGFLIERITPASVIVRQDTYRFELRMQQ